MGAEEREDRAAEIVGEWQRAHERGGAPAPDEVLRRHPDVEGELREAFATRRLLDRACADPAPESATTTPHESAPASESDAPRLDRIGDFRLVREIGRGGMGVVYEAEQVSMRRPVALKVLYPSVTTSAKAIERFRREAQATGRLHHTNIVQVHAMGSDEGHWYYAMEHVRGRALSEILTDLRRLKGDGGARAATEASSAISDVLSTSTGRRVEYARIAKMFAGVAEALATAHDAGVIHRDVKPSNLMLDDTATLKILDFGLASIREEPHGVTMTGDVLGTPAYMSPEQARAQPVDGRADVYSLGATLYEVLTLRPPVEGRNVSETLHRVVTREPLRPRRVESRIPRDLETIVLKALEKEPGRRYACAAAFAHDLRAFAEGFAIVARRVGPLGRAWRSARRHPTRAALAAAAITAVGMAIALAFGVSRANAERDREAAQRRDIEYHNLLVRALTGRDSRLFKEATDLIPDRPDAWYQRALYRYAPLRDLLADLDAARARGLSDARYHLARAVLLRGGDLREKAIAEEGLASRDASSDPDVSTLHARIAAADGRNDEAERLLDRVIGAAPPDDFAAFLALDSRSELRRRREDYEGAIADLMAERARAATGVQLPVLDARVAILWRRLGRPEATQKHVDQTLSGYETADTSSPYLRLGGALWNDGEFDLGRRAFEAGLRRFPDDMDLGNARLQWLPAEERLADADKVLARVGHGNTDVDEFRRTLLTHTKITTLEALGRGAEALSLAEQLARRPRGDSHDWNALARVSRQLGRFEEADAAHAQARRLDPFSVEAATHYASFLIGRDRLQDALKVVEEMLAVDSSASDLHDQHAVVLWDLGRKADAVEAARKAVRLAGGGARLQWHFPKAAVYVLTDERPSEVLDLVERLCREDPSDEFARTQLARILLRLDRAAEARTVLDRTPPLEPTWTVLYVRMLAAAALRRYPELGEVARSLIQMKPDEPDAYFNLGYALAFLHQDSQAIEPFERFLELAPKTPANRVDTAGLWGTVTAVTMARAHYLLGSCLEHTGDAKRALSHFDAALSLGGESEDERAGWIVARALALSDLGRVEDATTAVREAMSLRPSDANAHYVLARTLAKARDYKAATKAMRKAIRLDSDGGCAEWHHDLANYLFYLDELPASSAEADRALALGDRTAAVWASLARSLNSKSDAQSVRRAKALADDAMKLGNDPGFELFVKGAAHAASGEWSESSVWLGKAVDNCNAVLSRALLARSYIHLGRLDEARMLLPPEAIGKRDRFSRLARRVVEDVTRELRSAIYDN